MSTTIPHQPLKQEQQQQREGKNETDDPSSAGRRRLDIAIVGAPNAGKSQLLNVLLQQKVAAVSRKRHTTRNGIFGVRTIPSHQTQLVFVDTPGFVKSSRLVNSSQKEDPNGIIHELSSAAMAEMDSVDYTLLVIDAARSLGRLEPDVPNPYRDAVIALMIRATRAQGRQSLSPNIKIHDKSPNKKKGKVNLHITTDTTTPQPMRETFGIVLNKVDLVTPKSKLLDLAEQIGAYVDEVMHLYYTQHNQVQDDDEEEYDDDDRLPPPSPSPTRPIVVGGVEEEEASPIWEKFSPEFFYTSALHEDGVDEILDHLVKIATSCQGGSQGGDDDDDDDDDDWLIQPSDDDQSSPDGPSTSAFMSPTEQVEEIIREKLYRCLHREVPHHVRQINRAFRYALVRPTPPPSPSKPAEPTRTVKGPIRGTKIKPMRPSQFAAWQAAASSKSSSPSSPSATNTSNTTTTTASTTTPQKVLVIEQDLVVSTKSHHRLVHGRGNQTLKRIRDTAKYDLEEAFRCQVMLKLHVKFSPSMQERGKEAEEEGASVFQMNDPYDDSIS